MLLREDPCRTSLFSAALPICTTADRRAPRDKTDDGGSGWLAAKRLLDVVGALCGLLLAAPALALAALAIRLDSPGPVFFGQTRCGKDGRQFTMWKLRSMTKDAEAKRAAVADRNTMSGPVFKAPADPRITRVGTWLRRFSIDEIPQFWNVLRGEMSLVGPRPPLPEEVAQYDARQKRRLAVAPGLTCTWQISGRNEIGFEEWVDMDLNYIDNWTFSRDLVLLALTVPAVLGGRGSY
jgi:lipopolysaccharide/colanic/teichoic acid biosynthesis glycosyltransferase